MNNASSQAAIDKMLIIVGLLQALAYMQVISCVMLGDTYHRFLATNFDIEIPNCCTTKQE